MKGYQVNIDGHHIVMHTGQVIPSKIYSDPLNAVVGGLQVHGPTTLDWVNCKNIMVPSISGSGAFVSYALMQLDITNNRLQFIREDGQVWGVNLSNLGGNNRASQIEGNTMEAEAEMQLLPDTQLDPAEAALRGHINDLTAVGNRTITNFEADLLGGEAAGAPQQEL
jgi:hypothetical protein